MLSRLRRLTADREQVLRIFTDHPYVSIVEEAGNPPDKYTFEFRVPGMVPSSDGSWAIGNAHRAEVYLPLDYPRRPPFCRMLTPVYHPNIDPQKICIGDHWSAGQTVAQLVIRIAEMICFQSYNTKSPLNAQAAAWAEQNVEHLPLLRADLTVGL